MAIVAAGGRGMWPAGLPVAVEPLWQVAQVPVTALWSNRTALQLVVRWQSSHPAWSAMWFAGLPGAVEPLWQWRSCRRHAAWLKRHRLQVEVRWQSSQAALVGDVVRGFFRSPSSRCGRWRRNPVTALW